MTDRQIMRVVDVLGLTTRTTAAATNRLYVTGATVELDASSPVFVNVRFVLTPDQADRLFDIGS